MAGAPLYSPTLPPYPSSPVPSPLLHTRHCLFNGVNLCLVNYLSHPHTVFCIQASVSLRFCASSDSDRWWMQEATGCDLNPVLKMIFLTHKWNRRHLFPSSQFQLASCTKRNRRLGTYHSRLEDLRAQIRKQLRLTTDKRALRRTDSYFRKRLHFEKASLLCNYPHPRAV